MRDFARVDGPFDDAVIGGLLVTARDLAENYLRRSLLTRTLRGFLNHFPGYSRGAGASGTIAEFSTQHLDNFTHNLITVRGEAVGDADGRIHLPFPPLRDVISVKYYDTNGALQTMNAGDYIVDTDGSLVSPAYGKWWPPTRDIPNAVTVDYHAGYGVAGDVPESIKTWIKRKTADLYENRETRDDPKGYSLLGPYRWYQFS